MTLRARKVLIASRNRGKIQEIKEILSKAGAEFLGLDSFPDLPDCPEEGTTFEENARDKAVFYSRLTGLAALGDDSGLEVDALDGAPGIYSARYAGEGATDGQRIDKLLAALRELPGRPRTGRFVCAVSLAEMGREVFAARGVCEGVLTNVPRGANGFGYDPVFEIPERGLTYAELSDDEKNSISHRGRALALLRAYLAGERP